MICIDTIFNDPTTAGLATGGLVLVYIMLLSISPYLPAAVLLGLAAGSLVYLIRGGTLLCSQMKTTNAEEVCNKQFKT